MNNPLEHFSARLGYRFQDDSLLRQAMTHRSVSRTHNNERLEFLGDAWLGQVVSTCLYQRFPQATEGQLTRMRASLVKGEMLACIAADMELGACLLLGQSERKSGGRRRESILADAFEAVVGAIVIDGGETMLPALVARWYGNKLESVHPDTAEKDPKTRLQEWLQARSFALPVYQVEQIHGQPPKQRFDVSCTLMESDRVFHASADSRRKAEQKAARQALAWIEEQA